MTPFFIGLVAVVVLLILVKLNQHIRSMLHNWLLTLERRGYINYMEESRGGTSGWLEIDKFTRPSVEHVQQAMDVEVESQEHDSD